MTLTPNFASLSSCERKALLNGPTISLATKHSGTSTEHLHQLYSAQCIVAHYRYRQLEEQANSVDRAFTIEYPIAALMAASPAFRDFIQRTGPCPLNLEINMHGVLPGLATKVLDWYVFALRADKWFEFLPVESSVEDADKYYWFYSYVAMWALCMTTFAETLRRFIEKLADEHGLADDVWTVELLLTHVPMDDPILVHIAKRYATLTVQNKMPLSDRDCDDISQKFTRTTHRKKTTHSAEIS
ncbi:hypothetical protein K458DRAFT_387093 [Lentithecium fluviatile CBS 122367]|uniref:BTB domain-containing protein n=1 Tax=Lentithecium fluviatile CBS 122367 TaxID=1168545 RepID=A0A6G1J791_9PLEO|nr:hypothetical protein K458DRAFT_387093 [Lentithecium fluviatile CBS 122367]